MKIQGLSIFLASMMLVCGSVGQAGEAYYIVKLQDMSKEVTTTLMSATEFKALEKAVQLENQCFQQAVAAAAKEFRENEANKGSTFAGSRVTPRKFLGTPERFSSQEKAQAKLTQIEEMESKKADRQAEREFAKSKGGKVAKKSPDEIARENKREMETRSAIELVGAKLAEIVAAKSGVAAPAADAKEGAPDEKKQAEAAQEAGKKAL